MPLYVAVYNIHSYTNSKLLAVSYIDEPIENDYKRISFEAFSIILKSLNHQLLG